MRENNNKNLCLWNFHSVGESEGNTGNKIKKGIYSILESEKCFGGKMKNRVMQR